jgi:hypothetical protein
MSFISADTPFSFIKLGGGLNDTGGPFDLTDNESPSLQNIDFDKFGSIMPRNGYTILNSVAIPTASPSTNPSLGLYWFRTPTLEKAIRVVLDKVYRMDALDGTWDDITGTGPKLNTTTDYPCDFTTFNSKVLFTNDIDVPKQWGGSGSISNMTVVTGLTQARFITNYQNYCIMANCVVSGVDCPTRLYFSGIKDETSWDAADFYEIGYNDGQEIMGIKVLGDRLIVYKTKSIWFITFTGNADIPFLIYKSNSPIGCVSPFSIQEVDNGHIFLSWDGLYYFDGLNSYKLSDKINNTIRGINRSRLNYFHSAYQFDKSRYLLSVASSTSTWNNLVISLTYDFQNTTGNIFKSSKFAGISASNIAIFNVSGVEERVYFDDYLGYTYRLDDGVNDNPSNTAQAVSSYYYTNWKNFNDICDKKGIPHAYIYHSNTSGSLNFSYSYDFSTIDQYTHSFSMLTTQTVSDLGVRRDLTGRGRVVRFKFSNTNTSTHYVIHGIGVQANLVSKA